jgi:hypothetical protein
MTTTGTVVKRVSRVVGSALLAIVIGIAAAVWLLSGALGQLG